MTMCNREPYMRLSELGHVFKGGINGFGLLGRELFYELLTHPYIRLDAINTPLMDVAGAISAIQHELTARTHFYQDAKVFSTRPGQITIVNNNDKRTIRFFSEQETADIPWHETDILHVVDCTTKDTSLELATAHLRLIREANVTDLENCGAMKVHIAASSPDAPRFFPGINMKQYRVQDFVVSCTPLEKQSWQKIARSFLCSTPSYAKMSEKEYSHSVLVLLEYIIARDGAAAAHHYTWELSHQSTTGGPDSLFVVCLKHIMCLHLPAPPESFIMGAHAISVGNMAGDRVWERCHCCKND